MSKCFRKLFIRHINLLKIFILQINLQFLFFLYFYFQVRETQARVEELETANSHLQRRLDKLKNAKSALLKEL